MGTAVPVDDLPDNVVPDYDLPDQSAPALDNSWTGAVKGVADAGLSATNKFVVGGVAAAARTANRLLPDWLGGEGSKAATEADINALEKYVTYEPQTAEGQDLANNVGGVLKPVGQVASKAVGAVVGDENVGATTDALATLGLPGARQVAGTAGRLVSAGADLAKDTRVGRAVQGAVDEVKASRAGPAPAAESAAKPTSGAFTAEDLTAKPAEAPTPSAEPVKADVAPEPTAAPEKPAADAKASAKSTPVTERLQAKIDADPQGVRAEYAALKDSEGGKVLNTDTARELSPDYAKDKESRSALAPEVHEPASSLVKQMYAEKLAEAPKPGENPEVMFTAGGTGAGKTSGINSIPALKKMRDQSQIVYDTNMNTVDSARGKIQAALDAGKTAHIVYVYRDPVEAFANGTLPRAERMGRTVPIAEQARTHAGSYDTINQLRQEFAADPRVKFTAVDNSAGRGKQAVVPFEKLEGKRYNVGVEDLRPVVEDQLRTGKISDRVYDGTLGVKNAESKAAAGAEVNAGAAQTGDGVSGASLESGRSVRGGSASAEVRGPGADETVPGGAKASGGQNSGRPQGAPEALDHPLEFLPPEAEGTKSKAAPAAEQDSRAATLRALGLKEVRNSALSGDYKESGTDFQTSKLDHAGGKRMNSVMENERQALRNYSEGLVERTGGTAETDAIARRNRGQAIAAPIEAYDAALEAETKKLYAIADQRAAGQAIKLDAVGNILTKEKAAFLGTTEGKQLLEGVTARAKELGLLGDNDVFHPATVEQAERLRQYLNDNYSPRAGKLIAKLKDAIDDDVTRVAGADIYAAGRKIRSARAMNLEDPVGVSKLLAPEDRLGINRDVAHEDIPKYVTSLSSDQFGHVVRVLKDAGKNAAIAPQAATALNEIRATFANAVRDAGESTQGMWNAKGVNKYLRDNSARMEQVFSPEEMRQYQTLNDGGRILRMDRSYPGAAAQGHNFVVNGAIQAAEHGATAAGAVMGHIPGALAGHAIGKGVKALDSRAISAAVEKRIRTL